MCEESWNDIRLLTTSTMPANMRLAVTKLNFSNNVRIFSSEEETPGLTMNSVAMENTLRNARISETAGPYATTAPLTS